MTSGRPEPKRLEDAGDQRWLAIERGPDDYYKLVVGDLSGAAVYQPAWAPLRKWMKDFGDSSSLWPS